jgi:hypothetical protein
MHIENVYKDTYARCKKKDKLSGVTGDHIRKP